MDLTTVQHVSLDEWLRLHIPLTKEANNIFCDTRVQLARNIFNTPQNELLTMLTMYNAELAAGTLSPIEAIPSIEPVISWIELSARIELWAQLEKWMITPMPRTGWTPMQVLSKVR